MSSPAKAPASPDKSTSDKTETKDVKPQTTLELLEEDDEFEEFNHGSWDDGKANEAEDNALWRDNWDDDDGKDDFLEQLRTHISTTGK